jgi:hypothetical protein
MPAKKDIEKSNDDVIKGNEAIPDIEKMIQEAVAKAIKETSKVYEKQIEELKNQNNQTNIQEYKEENLNVVYRPEKMIWIQHMGLGSASFKRGKVSISFAKLFDKRKIKWEMLDEMFYEFRDWFDNFELVILDKEAREYYNIENEYGVSGADESKFKSMMSMSNSGIIDEIDKMTFIVAMSFLKYFIDEQLKGNPKCFENNKLKSISDYYGKKYSVDVQSSINEITQE